MTVTGKGDDQCMLFYKLDLSEDKNQFTGFPETASYIRRAEINKCVIFLIVSKSIRKYRE